jgi:hypothetical protein
MMLRFAERHGWISEHSVEVPIVALAAACFATAQAAGGSAFIACFVGGLLPSGLGARHKEELLRGAEHTGEALALLTWFGPRGLATIAFAVLVLDEKLPGNDAMMLAAGWTVLLSVIAHGVTRQPAGEEDGGALGRASRPDGRPCHRRRGSRPSLRAAPSDADTPRLHFAATCRPCLPRPQPIRPGPDRKPPQNPEDGEGCTRFQ